MAIATFDGQSYSSRRGQHAAIYVDQNDEGMWVYDQFNGHNGNVKLRFYPWNGRSFVGSGNNYYTIRV